MDCCFASLVDTDWLMRFRGKTQMQQENVVKSPRFVAKGLTTAPSHLLSLLQLLPLSRSALSKTCSAETLKSKTTTTTTAAAATIGAATAVTRRPVRQRRASSASRCRRPCRGASPRCGWRRKDGCRTKRRRRGRRTSTTKERVTYHQNRSAAM